MTDFSETKPDLAALTRQGLMHQRIQALGLSIDGSRLQPLVDQLYAELREAGLREFAPPVYLTDEWGCPEGIPMIGIPFYLADESLTRLEEEINGDVEAESDQDIIRYLRHEAGHALNYAYALFKRADWQATFGDYGAPYLERYRPIPFSRRFVRHIPGWYAQKHPDEDFAESFAVWLDPLSQWEKHYAEWPALEKLRYVDRIVRDLGRTTPIVSADAYEDVIEPDYSIELYYADFGYRKEELAPEFDLDLRQLFPDDGADEPATALIRASRKLLVRRIAQWTGLYEGDVRSLIDHFVERCDALELRYRAEETAIVLADIAICATTLCMNRLASGAFIPPTTDPP